MKAASNVPPSPQKVPALVIPPAPIASNHSSQQQSSGGDDFYFLGNKAGSSEVQLDWNTFQADLE